MKQQLWICLFITFAAVAGCTNSKRPQTPAQVGPINSQGFLKQWQADYGALHDPITELNVVNNDLVAYTHSNNSYWLETATGAVIANNKVTSAGHSLLPPVVLGDQIIIPTTASFELFDKSGHRKGTLKAPRVLQSAAVPSVDSLFMGVVSPGGGRLAKILIDGTNSARVDWEIYAGDGMLATPAIIGDGVFGGGVDGQVWAVALNRAPLWPMSGNVFKTDASITGDLAADEDGVYVASQDQKLYCLNRAEGKIKWTYYSGRALVRGPMLVGNLILQPVPGKGIVALSRTEGGAVREALWTQPAANQVLMADDSYIYVASGGGTILALDKKTGEVQFQSRRNDLKTFATYIKGPLIYAATRSNSILGIKPITRAGTGAGEIVRRDGTDSDWIAVSD